MNGSQSLLFRYWNVGQGQSRTNLFLISRVGMNHCINQWSRCDEEAADWKSRLMVFRRPRDMCFLGEWERTKEWARVVNLPPSCHFCRKSKGTKKLKALKKKSHYKDYFPPLCGWVQKQIVFQYFINKWACEQWWTDGSIVLKRNSRGRIVITPSARSAPVYLRVYKYWLGFDLTASQTLDKFGHVGLMFEMELFKRRSLLLRKHRWKNRPQLRRERRQLGRFGESEGGGMAEEKGAWFRVTRRGRRLLLKHLNASKSAASLGSPVVGSTENEPPRGDDCLEAMHFWMYQWESVWLGALSRRAAEGSEKPVLKRT